VLSIKRSRCVKHQAGQHTLTAPILNQTCDKFLYGFKAAPRGRSRRRLGGMVALPLPLTRSRPKTPVGWREETLTGAAITRGSHEAAAT
jgi:hypothetical protein